LAAYFKVSLVLHSARYLSSPPTLSGENVAQGFFVLRGFMNEIWKDIPNYEGRYQVSNTSNVKSVKANLILKPNMMTHGYTCVHLYDGKGKKNRRVFTVHRLVAFAFIPNPLALLEVNHKNFDRSDNSIDNLEWVTRTENVQHAIDAGRKFRPEKRIKGINLKTGKILTFESQVQAEETLLGGRTGGISHSLSNNSPAYGYIWWTV
jgi:hypothetical protein